MTAYLLERALLPTGVADDVLVEIVDGRFSSVLSGRSLTFPGVATADHYPPDPRPAGPTPTRLPGLTLPGLANGHSHAFHRALRGRTQRGRGTFWTWREQMYDVAGRLDPDTYRELALATYREMVAAGITCVGEFHYLHHQPDGTPYDDPNVMGHALLDAAREAGLRITLLDTCYLAAGIGRAPEGVQRRFDDGDAGRWAERAAAVVAHPDVARTGAAIHSIRAVPRDQVPTVVAAAHGRPLHTHLSEQPAENEVCLAAYGLTPTGLLHEAGALGPETTVVHATHLSDADVRRLGEARVYADLCPTTERDLADGIGPARALVDAGARLTVGSDSHAVIDLFEELRAVELDERLATRRRGHWTAAELLAAATATGHESLGWPDAGRIEVGARADLVTLDTASVRTAGTGADEQTAVFAATAADVTHVVIDGRVVHRRGDEGAVGGALSRSIERLWRPNRTFSGHSPAIERLRP